MGAPRFTMQQRKAIDFKSGNCLVAAGAGSGKTAVLTERIYWLVVPPLDEGFSSRYRATHNGASWGPDDTETEPIFQSWDKAPAKLSQLLVLTFTNKAAYEMKDRVRQKIASHKETRDRLLSEVEQSSITTFDAYSLDLVKTYHYEVGVDEVPAIVDQTLLNVEKKRLLDEIFESRYQGALSGEDPAFKRFIYELALTDDKDLKRFILDIDALGDLKIDKEAFLSSYIAEAYSESYVERRLEQYLSAAKGYIESYKAGLSLVENGDIVRIDSDYLDPALDCIDWDAFYHYFQNHPSFPRIAKDSSIEDKSLRDKLKKKNWEKLKEMLFGDAATLKSDYLATKDNVSLAIDIAKELDKRLNAFKRDHASFGFADIASLARKIVNKKEIGDYLKKKFKFIMVDEYQDTSDLQEALISAISNNNVFCVGDIKQSIYRFRNANPKIFADKNDSYGEGVGGTLITLPHNFRSRRQVIESINAMFAKIMSKSVGGVNYSNGQSLEFGNHSFDETEVEENYGLSIFSFTKDGAILDNEQEAEIIAKDIRYKVEHGYRVKGKEGWRPCAYSDFAILMSKKRPFIMYQKVFNDYQIPLSVSDSTSEVDPDVIIVLRNLCRLTLLLSHGEIPDGTAKHLYASLARSFLFEIPEERVASAILKGDYCEEGFFSLLRKESYRLAKMPLLDICYYFITTFNLPSKLTVLGDIQDNLERVEAFLDMARSFSGFGWGLEEFVAYFDDMKEYEEDIDIEANALERNAVKCMSIHASKGLQFKVVYFPLMQAEFKKTDMGATYFSAKEGTGILLPNVHASSSPRTFISSLYGKGNAEEEVSERMRLWYVALTRAEEKMIVLMPKPEEEEEEDPENPPADKRPPSIEGSNSFYHFMQFAEPSCPVIDLDATDHEPIRGSTKEEYEQEKQILEENRCEKEEQGAGKVMEEEPKAAEAPVNPYPLQFRHVNCPGIIEPSVRASKEVMTPVDLGALAYGNRLHRLMELIDFKTKDTSFIHSPYEREIVDKVLSLDLFKDSENAKQFSEYQFSADGSIYVIDLYLLYDDHIDLLDYKSSNIDDPNYESQLSVYEAFLNKAYPGKKINKYLLSLKQGVAKRVS